MVFNKTYKLTHTLMPLLQQEILNTPEYYAMNWRDIINHHTCPDHLARILNAFPWTGRPNVVQVRPQDFRIKEPHILGTGWHSDCNTHLRNGVNHVAKTLDEFSLFTVSFGDVTETQFIKNPIDIPDHIDPFNHVQFAGFVGSQEHYAVTAKPNQLAEYTSRDIHRVSPDIRLGNARLIIVAYECDEHQAKQGGEVGKSINERTN